MELFLLRVVVFCEIWIFENFTPVSVSFHLGFMPFFCVCVVRVREKKIHPSSQKKAVDDDDDATSATAVPHPRVRARARAKRDEEEYRFEVRFVVGF